MLKVLVTTGGTKEPIDDVRFITNGSIGKFGHDLARLFAGYGHETTIFCPHEVPILAAPRIEHAKYFHFTSAASLQHMIEAVSEVGFVIHAAAVSDYRPEQVSGKVSSDAEEMVLRLVKTHKILPTLRELFGKKTFIVGFKLLSGVSRRALIAAAIRQNRSGRLNLTVANDWKRIENGLHPVVLVTPEEGAIELVGKRQEVAMQLFAFIKKRVCVTWFQTVQREGARPHISSEELASFSRLLGFAQHSRLLYDSSGNVSVRVGHQYVMVTPRQVDKKTVLSHEACLVKINLSDNTVHNWGKKKSSIDTGIQEVIYRAFPLITHLLHFHSPWGYFERKTSFPYPCGVREEADEIVRSLRGITTESFTVELIHHGALMGFDESGLRLIEQEWKEALDEYTAHLNRVGRGDVVHFGMFRPIFHNTHIVGVALEVDGEIAVYLKNSARGKKVGRAVISQIIARQIPVRTIDACDVIPFYTKHGFSVKQAERTGEYLLIPPPLTKSDELFGRIDEWKNY